MFVPVRAIYVLSDTAEEQGILVVAFVVTKK